MRYGQDMKHIAALWLALAACGGPTQQQLADTPTGRTRATPTEAPAASTSDRDREGLRQQFDDMEATQRARKEAADAAKGSGAGPVVPGGQPDTEKKPAKKGPAQEAPSK